MLKYTKNCYWKLGRFLVIQFRLYQSFDKLIKFFICIAFLFSKPVIFEVGFIKQGQGFHKATFLKNSVMDSKHDFQYTPRIVCQKAVDQKKGLHVDCST